MKKSLGSKINLNRKSILLTGLVFSLVSFGVIAWNVDAQDSAKKSWTKEEAATRAAMMSERLAKDEVAPTVARAKTEVSSESPSVVFSNPAAIVPADRVSNNAGTNPGLPPLYPSPIVVSGLSGTITKVTVTFGVTSTFPDDLDVLLVGPTGAQSLVLSDAGGSGDPVNVSYIWDQTGALMPDNPTTIVPAGTFQPSNYVGFVTPEPGGQDNFPNVSGLATYPITFDVFNGTSPNGTWSLYVVDDQVVDTNSLPGGWSIDITTGGATPTPTNTPTATPTNTPTATPTATPAGTATPTNTPTATPTATPAGTATPTSTPTATPTPPPGACSTASTVLYGYNIEANSDNLVRFTAAAPGTYTSTVPMTGLTADEFLGGIDFRPANGIMYGVVFNLPQTRTRTVAINTSGELVPVGGNLAPTADIFLGVDFNPVPDRIRVVGDTDTSRRLNPNDGTLSGTDSTLTYVAGDPGVGTNPTITHVAYTNSVAGATLTTLYGIDTARDTLVRIGGVDGNPSPNLGQVTTIGPLGVEVAGFGGFDIQPGTNTAYAALAAGPVGARIMQLFTINLTTGAATLIGNIGNGTNVIDGLTVAPCSTAAGVEVAGRVLTPDGRGLRNSVVSMTDSSGVVRTATTSTFGYYRFDDVEVGGSYVMSVESRRYRFSPRVVQVFDNLTDVDFTGQE